MVLGREVLVEVWVALSIILGVFFLQGLKLVEFGSVVLGVCYLCICL